MDTNTHGREYVDPNTELPYICKDCGRTTYYDHSDRDYHHIRQPERGCFLIRGEDRDDTYCDGCDGDESGDYCVDVRPYLVETHDGDHMYVHYCAACAGLASIDWNGETAAISAVPDVPAEVR